MPNRILSCPKIGIYPIHRVSGNIKNAQGRPANSAESFPQTSEALRNLPESFPQTSEALRNPAESFPQTAEALRNPPESFPQTSEALRYHPAEPSRKLSADCRSPTEPSRQPSATPAGLQNRCKYRFFPGFFVKFDKIEGGPAQANQKTGAFICQCARVLLFLPATKLSTTAYGPNSI